MKEAGGHQVLSSVVDSAFLISHHQHLYGSPALETLPEAENEDDCGRSSGTSSPSQPEAETLFLDESCSGLERNSDLSRRGTPCDLPESQHVKVLSLERTIRELRDELRECQDQNELLEFRLLEMQQLGSSPPSQRRNQVCCGAEEREKNGVQELDEVLYGTEVTSETTMHGDYEISNSHSSVAESRSSCSECSESLSLQESGIFESPFTDESGSGSSSRQEEVGRELGVLTSQIQSLVLRFAARADGRSKRDFPPSRVGDGHLRKRETHQSDVSSELKICRDRVLELERRLSQLTDVTYIQSLEDKVSSLIHHNRSLEDERAELEEAENDNRHECQRLEAKMKELREKKALLQNQLFREKRYVEQVRVQVLQLREREDDLIAQLIRTEALAQAHEQRNFELEELHIEIKDSVHFAVNVVPSLVLWYLYPIWLAFHRSRFLYRFLSPSPLTPISKSFEENKLTQTQLNYGTQNVDFPASLLARESDELVRMQSEDREKLEEFLRKQVEVLELDIAQCRQECGNERRELVESYERKLAALERRIGESAERLKEHGVLEEKWNRLIKELERFEAFLLRGINEWERKEGSVSPGTPSSSNDRRCKVREGTLVASRIRSLFPDEWAAVTEKCAVPAEPLKRLPLVLRLEQAFLEQMLSFEDRERKLLAQVGELQTTLLENPTRRAESDNQHITHLLEENNRLEGILAEEDRAWARIRELEEETELLRNEMNASLSLQRRLDDAQGVEKVMRLRIEELEQRESLLSESLQAAKRREKKWQDGAFQFRDEISALQTRCSQVEQELDLKADREKKYKSQIQILTAKVKASQEMLEEKERLLEIQEASFQTQIVKLEKELAESRLENADSECTIGMLREEVLYLERRLTELTERLAESENKTLLLLSELEHREESLKESQRLLTEADDQETFNDLDDFAMKEGGLIGVAREVKAVMDLLQSCCICKQSAAKKLTEVSEQLNTLTLMLGGDETYVYRNETHWMLRCESEEHLSDSPPIRRDKRTETQLASFHSSSETVGFAQVETERRLREQDVELQRMQAELQNLSLQLQEAEQNYKRAQSDEKDSHLNEAFLWKMRCEEKNDLIQILARRLTHLSATDLHGYFLEGVLREIRKVDERYPVYAPSFHSEHGDLPQDSRSLLRYLQQERTRIMELLESVCEEPEMESDSALPQKMDFQVLRRIGEDALLVSWLNASRCSSLNMDGYEICVNGHPFLKVPNPRRYRALLFGLNLTEPLHLSLKCAGSLGLEESTITYIA